MQPLPGIKNPLDTLAAYGFDFTGGSILPIALATVFVIWLVYTLVVSYHWIRYSHASLIAYPAIFVHLVVSVLIMSYALTGSVIPTT